MRFVGSYQETSEEGLTRTQKAHGRYLHDVFSSKDATSSLQEVGFAHMRISDGVVSLLQLSGLLAKLCLVKEKAKA